MEHTHQAKAKTLRLDLGLNEVLRAHFVAVDLRFCLAPVLNCTDKLNDDPVLIFPSEKKANPLIWIGLLPMCFKCAQRRRLYNHLHSYLCSLKQCRSLIADTSVFFRPEWIGQVLGGAVRQQGDHDALYQALCYTQSTRQGRAR